MNVTTTNPMPSKSSHILQGGDTLRVIATLAVIMIHVATRIMDQKPLPGTTDWWSVSLYVAMARWCVPVFVLLSGALLLDPAKDEAAPLFYRKRIRRVGIPLAVWSIGYLTMDLLVGEPMGWRGLAWRVVTGGPYYHLWFLYMIVGLYLVTPLLRVFVRHATDAQRWGLVALFLALSVGQDAFHALTWDNEAPFVLTRFVPYLGYFLGGYQLRTLQLSKIRVWPLILIIVICVPLMAMGSYLMTQWLGCHRSRYLYGYQSPLVMMTSLAVFLWAIKILPMVDQNHALARLMRHMSVYTLGIYLVHPLVIGGLHRMGLDVQQMFAPWGIPFLTLLVFAISYGMVVVMKQVPVLRQMV